MLIPIISISAVYHDIFDISTNHYRGIIIDKRRDVGCIGAQRSKGSVRSELTDNRSLRVVDICPYKDKETMTHTG
jgi:hypothetical protein